MNSLDIVWTGVVRRVVHGTAMLTVLLAALVTMSTLVSSFNVAPRVMQSRRNQAYRSLMPCPATQKSAELELADETTRLAGIAQTVFGQDTRPVLLYDGVCNMCNSFVNLVLDIDSDAKVRFSALQSQTGRELLSLSGRSPEDISSIVLVEANGDAHIQSDAVLRLGRVLGGPVGLVIFPGVFIPKFARNKMYDTVADNRYSVLGKREECRCSDERYADRFI